jgi:hypothetical protein
MKRLLLASTAVVVFLSTSLPAEAARCSLTGHWEAFLKLSHLNDEDQVTPWPPVAITCNFHIKRDGSLNMDLDGSGQPRSRCGSIAYLEGHQLTVNSNCHISSKSELYFEQESVMLQSQEIYTCRMKGTVDLSGNFVTGWLSCGHTPELFTMVKRR